MLLQSQRWERNYSPPSNSLFVCGGWGEERYHHKHPFHVRMHEGLLTRGQLQAWALNRYYYQSRIPIKDALILARTDDAAFRRAWRKRIVDHDGSDTQRGGIEKWVRLAEATGLAPERVLGNAIEGPSPPFATRSTHTSISCRSAAS